MDDKNKKAIGIGLGALAIFGLGAVLLKKNQPNPDLPDTDPIPVDPDSCLPGYTYDEASKRCKADVVPDEDSESGVPLTFLATVPVSGQYVNNWLAVEITPFVCFLYFPQAYDPNASFEPAPQPCEVLFGDEDVNPPTYTTTGGRGRPVVITRNHHVYLDYGTYPITLTMIDAYGHIGSITRKITVTAQGIAGSGCVAFTPPKGNTYYLNEQGEQVETPVYAGLVAKVPTGHNVVTPNSDVFITWKTGKPAGYGPSQNLPMYPLYANDAINWVWYNAAHDLQQEPDWQEGFKYGPYLSEEWKIYMKAMIAGLYAAALYREYGVRLGTVPL